MTKEDLQCGYLVLTRDREYAIVTPVTNNYNEEQLIILFEHGTYLNLSDYNDNLTFRTKDFSNCDIVKVFGFMNNNYTYHELFSEGNRELLWDNCKKMTLKEIEKELGYAIVLLKS